MKLSVKALAKKEKAEEEVVQENSDQEEIEE
jgi:hypothetical protein